MTYHFFGPDGLTYGPFDVATLQAWARDGRLATATLPISLALGVISGVHSLLSTPWKPCNYP